MEQQVNDLATQAEQAVIDETGNADHHWACVFRKCAQDANLTRWDLHTYLRSAADSFHRTEPRLAKRLNDICGILDTLRK